MKKRTVGPAALGMGVVMAAGLGAVGVMAQAPATVGQPGTGVAAAVPAREFREFDVASIREDRSGRTGHTNNPPGGTYEASLTLTGFIFFAYNLSVYQNTVLMGQVPE